MASKPKEPTPSCSHFLDDMGEGFVCRVGSNAPELIKWRLGWLAAPVSQEDDPR